MLKETIDGDNIFLIRDFLTLDECLQFIAVSEQAGYSDAPITTTGGFVMVKEVRNNDRVMIDDVPLAAKLFDRAKPFLPSPFMIGDVVGLNERFRYYRYDIGQRFARHYDGCFERDNGERSQFTFMVYLNDDFTGGETKFYHGERRLIVTPKRGSALVFYHLQLHEGAPIEKGRKYVLRTDVMYLPRARGKEKK
jgi:predicted 2-oxoglutarate/Fe(II)-dependent dioxygenase YbiX